MAKKATTRNFEIEDLILNKPTLKYLVIPPQRVDVVIEVTTTGILTASQVASTKMERLEKAAKKALAMYEQVISEEAEVLDVKVGKLVLVGKIKEAEAMVQGANQSIKKALLSAEGAAQKAIQSLLKDEAQKDSSLKEARVRTVLKWTAGGISLATSVAKLVATHGADVTSYISIAKQLKTLAEDVQQQMKAEDELRKDLVVNVQAYFASREKILVEFAKRQLVDMSKINASDPIGSIDAIAAKVAAVGGAAAKGRSLVQIAKDVHGIVSNGVTPILTKAETSRKAYREHTTKTRHKTDGISAEADKLDKAMKAAKTLKLGVQIGAQCMSVKRSARAMAVKLDNRETFLQEMQKIMAGEGMEIDDRTTLQKLKELDKLTIASEIKDIYSFASGIKDLISAVS